MAVRRSDYNTYVIFYDSPGAMGVDKSTGCSRIFYGWSHSRSIICATGEVLDKDKKP